MPFLPWLFRSTCDARGDTTGCLFFALNRVEYKPSDCKLGINHHEIIFHIEGLKLNLGFEPEHEGEFEVRELGQGGRAEFAPNEPNPTFIKGSQKGNYTISCGSPTTLTFYIKKVDPPPAGPLEVTVKCIFRHCIPGQIPWHEHTACILLKRS